MPTIIIGKGKNPECPLCNKPFERAQLMSKQEYFFCRKDKVQIFATDPMLEQWTNVDPETGEGIPCSNPNCREKMNVFCKSNGYMKAVCPNKRCGAEIESHQIPDAHMDVQKGKGVEGVNDITGKGEKARKRWLDN